MASPRSIALSASELPRRGDDPGSPSSLEISGGARDPELELARGIARWTDTRFLDPILGLVVPGVGDLLTAAAGLFMVRLAARRGLPRVVIARMLMNLGIDTALGSIPLVGDAFDFAWRANRKNLALLESRHPGRSKPGDWLLVAGAAALFLAALAAPIVLLVWFIRAI